MKEIVSVIFKFQAISTNSDISDVRKRKDHDEQEKDDVEEHRKGNSKSCITTPWANMILCAQARRATKAAKIARKNQVVEGNVAEGMSMY